MMGFWDLFKNNKENESVQTSLFYELKTNYSYFTEDELVKIACVSGLLARVAYVDFIITFDEKLQIENSLMSWTSIPLEQITAIAEIAINHIKELAGLENHMYVHHLKPFLTIQQRYELIETLFALAASDGVVENIESEEIRLINKGFDLSDQHFLSARATVFKKLAALKM